MELLDSVTEIKRWFDANNASAIVANLNIGATPGTIQAAIEQGFLLTDEMQKLYSLHDGQPDSYSNLFMPNAGFMNLSYATQVTDEVLKELFGCPSGHRTTVEEWEGHGLAGDADDLMLKEEWTPAWFCFACSTEEYLLQNFHSRRVFSWHRKGEVTLLGDTLEDMLTRFANALSAGNCWLSGDTSLPGVIEEGIADRLVVWYP